MTRVGASNRILDITVVTGMSGAGKSTAIAALEDAGYYCIDNLPTALLPRFLELCVGAEASMARVALGLDVRDEHYVELWDHARELIEEAGHHLSVLFVDASDAVLIRRFSETRRRHPLSLDRTLEEALADERRALEPIRTRAARIIDTGAMSVHELKAEVRETLLDSSERKLGPSVTVKSFGFKHGMAADADIVFDVRFLPNPYFVDELRALTGLDEDVRDFVLERDVTRSFLERTLDLLDFLLPRYAAEGKVYLTLALGCTGGQHRSVAMAEEFARRLDERGVRCKVRHRDVERAGR